MPINNCMAMIKDFASAPTIGVRQIVKRCNSLSYYYYYFNAVSFLLGMSKSLGLMILLARLKFFWRILNFAGVVFEAKVALAKDSCQKKICWTITPLCKIFKVLPKSCHNAPHLQLPPWWPCLYLALVHTAVVSHSPSRCPLTCPGWL